MWLLKSEISWRGGYTCWIRSVPGLISPVLSVVFLNHNSDHVIPNLSTVPNYCTQGWNFHALARNASLHIMCPLPTFCSASLLFIIGSFYTLAKSASVPLPMLFPGRESCPTLLTKFLLIPHDLSQWSSGVTSQPLRGLIIPSFVWLQYFTFQL